MSSYTNGSSLRVALGHKANSDAETELKTYFFTILGSIESGTGTPIFPRGKTKTFEPLELREKCLYFVSSDEWSNCLLVVLLIDFVCVSGKQLAVTFNSRERG